VAHRLKEDFKDPIHKKLTRARVVPTTSDKVSWPIFGITFSVLASFLKRSNTRRIRANPGLLESDCFVRPDKRQKGLKTSAHCEALFNIACFSIRSMQQSVIDVADDMRKG